MRTPPYPGDPLPDPQFQQRLLRILERWQSSELPYQEARSALEALAREARLTGQALHESMACNSLANVCSAHGLFDDAIHAMRASLRLLEECGARGRAAVMLSNLSEVYLSAGRYDEARAIAQEALERAQALDYRFGIFFALDHLGRIAIRQGQYAEARARLEEVLDLSAAPIYDDPGEVDKRRLAGYRAVILSELASAALAMDDLSGAEDYACRAIDEAQHSPPMAQGYAWRALGDVITRTHRTPCQGICEDPDECYQQAIACFQGVDADVEVAQTYMQQAASLAQRGQKTRAQQALSYASIVYQRLGLKDDAQRAEHARATLR